jgi:hypothetical protein
MRCERLLSGACGQRALVKVSAKGKLLKRTPKKTQQNDLQRVVLRFGWKHSCFSYLCDLELALARLTRLVEKGSCKRTCEIKLHLLRKLSCGFFEGN